MPIEIDAGTPFGLGIKLRLFAASQSKKTLPRVRAIGLEEEMADNLGNIAGRDLRKAELEQPPAEARRVRCSLTMDRA